jgi:hypothetical protein
MRWANGREVEVKINGYTVSQTFVIASKDMMQTEHIAAQFRLD